MKKILFALMVIILSSQTVFAASIAKAGEIVTDEGNYEATRFVAGYEVTSKSTVNGISFVAGNDVTVEGSAPYGVYAGYTVTINGKIENDLFVAGKRVVLEEKAVLGRDVYIAGSAIKVKTNITRNLRAAGNSVDLRGVTVGGSAYVAADKIILDENTVITGKLVYEENANVTDLDKATVGAIETKKTSQEVITPPSFKSKAVDFIFSYCAAVITLVVVFFLLPKLSTKLEKEEITAKDIAKKSGIGLAGLIVIPIVSLIALFTVVLTPVALIASAVYIITIYLSTLFIGYIIGHLLMTKVFKNDSKYLKILLGVLVFRIGSLVPILNTLLPLIGTLYGLGIIYNLIITSKKSS